ncbi:hypothetical protein JM16_008122 [Phytophthora kernoviae]|uniref:RxLR effector protein n=1 Tax=Phytophthora kernoviae TaxID=325452 RepID=A0A8T0LMY4_9STRA|nr:hypothetical protein JM16_008119 [Phytophthora kernoviae]KAG2512342.1 hypothetical protein JM16_008122 [Phytophthora kernoviae]
MRLSQHLLAIAATLVLVSGNSLSMATDVDQNMALEVKSSHAVRSLGAGQTEDDKGKDYLRSLKTTAETNDGNGDGEEERGFVSSFKSLFTSSATKKAAAAAKQAELDKIIVGMRRDGNVRIDTFKKWAALGLDPNKQFTLFKGEFNEDARAVINMYKQFLGETKWARRSGVGGIASVWSFGGPSALIASMPSNLVHRMVINLVKESKRVKKKNRESRAQIETLERSLQSARRGAALLESARDGEAAMRTRMGEQQHIAQRLERELDTVKMELATAEAENRQLRSKVDNAERSQLRLEAKVSTML